MLSRAARVAHVPNATLLLFRGLINGQQNRAWSIGDEVLRTHIAARFAHPHAFEFRAGNQRVVRVAFVSQMGERLYAHTARLSAVVDDAGAGGGFVVGCHT